MLNSLGGSHRARAHLSVRRIDPSSCLRCSRNRDPCDGQRQAFDQLLWRADGDGARGGGSRSKPPSVSEVAHRGDRSCPLVQTFVPQGKTLLLDSPCRDHSCSLLALLGPCVSEKSCKNSHDLFAPRDCRTCRVRLSFLG